MVISLGAPQDLSKKILVESDSDGLSNLIRTLVNLFFVEISRFDSVDEPREEVTSEKREKGFGTMTIHSAVRRTLLTALIHVKQEGKVIEHSRTYMHGVVDGGGPLRSWLFCKRIIFSSSSIIVIRLRLE